MRYANNPILTPRDLAPSQESMKIECLLNPGVFRFDGKTWLLIRVAERPEQREGEISFPLLDDANRITVMRVPSSSPELDLSDPRVISYKGSDYLTTMSHLRLMSSTDGVRFAEEPGYGPIFGSDAYESYGIEDCRVTLLEGTYYLTYTAVSANGVAVRMRSTTDWKRFTDYGLVLPPHNKDCTLFDERIGDLYYMLHRPSSPEIGGNYIWIAESDDYADPAFLERCVAELDADPACVLAHTLSRTVDSEGRPFGKVRHAGRPVRRMDGRRFVLRHLLRRNELYNASMAVFRRSALPAAGEYEGFRYAGDWYFWMLVALQGRVSTVFEPLNAFRRHDAATTTQGERTGGLYEEVLQILPAIFSRMRTAAPVRWALEGKQLCRLHRARRRFGRNEAYERLWSRWCETYRCDPLRRAWYRIYGALPDSMFF